MDHEKAAAERAAERWIDGELSDSERAEFEAHFFDCADCAAKVRWEQVFVANLRAALRGQKPGTRARRA